VKTCSWIAGPAQRLIGASVFGKQLAHFPVAQLDLFINGALAIHQRRQLGAKAVVAGHAATGVRLRKAK
jgi:hypothetical protein